MNCKLLLVGCVLVAVASCEPYKFKSRRLVKRAEKEIKPQDDSPFPADSSSSSVKPTSAKPSPSTKAPATIHSSVKPSSPKPQADDGKDKLSTIAAVHLNATEVPENVNDAVVNRTTPHIDESSTKRPLADDVGNATVIVEVEGSGHEGSTERMVPMDDRMVIHDDRSSTEAERLVSGSVGSGDHEESTENPKRSSMGDHEGSTEIPRSSLKPKCERSADGKKSNEDCIEEKESSDDQHPRDEESKKPCCG